MTTPTPTTTKVTAPRKRAVKKATTKVTTPVVEPKLEPVPITSLIDILDINNKQHELNNGLMIADKCIYINNLIKVKLQGESTNSHSIGINTLLQAGVNMDNLLVSPDELDILSSFKSGYVCVTVSQASGQYGAYLVPINRDGFDTFLKSLLVRVQKLDDIVVPDNVIKLTLTNNKTGIVRDNHSTADLDYKTVTTLLKTKHVTFDEDRVNFLLALNQVIMGNRLTPNEPNALDELLDNRFIYRSPEMELDSIDFDYTEDPLYNLLDDYSTNLAKILYFPHVRGRQFSRSLTLFDLRSIWYGIKVLGIVELSDMINYIFQELSIKSELFSVLLNAIDNNDRHPSILSRSSSDPLDDDEDYDGLRRRSYARRC